MGQGGQKLEGGQCLLPQPPPVPPPLGKEDLRRRHSQKASPLSWPLGSHRPWLPAAVFLIEARCGPDALAEVGGRARQRAAFQVLLPPHKRPSTGTVPGARSGWEPPTLFPGLLGPETPFRGAPSLFSELGALGRQPLHLYLSTMTAPRCWRRRRERRKGFSWMSWPEALPSWGRNGGAGRCGLDPGEERVT